METLTEQLQPPEPCVPAELNGAVTVDDLDLLQKTNRDLEQQLADKNRVRCLACPPLSHDARDIECKHGFFGVQIYSDVTRFND